MVEMGASASLHAQTPYLCRNSLVFHSLDKITSLFLHLFPAGVVWTERWHPDVVRLSCIHADITSCLDWPWSPCLHAAMLPVDQNVGKPPLC